MLLCTVKEALTGAWPADPPIRLVHLPFPIAESRVVQSGEFPPRVDQGTREELPPTLCPGAIFRAAPPRKRGLSVLITLNVYVAMVLAAVAWGRLRQASVEGQRQIAARDEVTLVLEPDPESPSPALGPGCPVGSPTRMAPDGRAMADPTLVALDSSRFQEIQAEDMQEIPTTLPKDSQALVDLRLPATVGGNGTAASPGSGSAGDVRQGPGGTMFRAVPGLSQSLNLADLEVVHEEIPEYPLLAAWSNIQGDVVVRVTINEHGVPIRTELVEGPPQLCGVTMRAVKHWRFGKGLFRGKKVNAVFDMTFRFILRPR